MSRCGCQECRRTQDDRVFRDVSHDVRDTPGPLADWYSSPPMTLPRDPMPRQMEALVPYAAPIPKANFIGPSDRMPVISIGSAYNHELLRIRKTVPRPEWQHATGFSTIESRQVEPLAGIQYSFAAVDTEGLLDDIYMQR